ncbi:MAG: hypothetical protein HN919_10490 [Verrucomicrobia bacterium]|jgi:hypothetical protein|nr:hypothetical protein [Verrucomicrobiota bacterium]MBT7066720.1 hypothetical protein [Verrucomicrobiota bacterium]MBT7700789.1 hypothetical protein [Verrucomicrobiota bacterium]
MNGRHLFFNELKYRWQGSLLAAAAVAVAVLSVTASLHLLSEFDRQTQQDVHALQQRSQERMDALENEARIFAKSLGFNILIYNGAQRLETFHANDVNTHYLTTEQAGTLAASDFGLLNHHLPFLRHRYPLPAFDGEVIIAGLEGEIYIKRRFQQPLEVRIEPGEVQLGDSVAERLNLKAGDSIAIGGASYKVTLCRKPLGTKDDIVIFMNLADAQNMLGLEGRISGILALSCNCSAGNIAPIRAGVQKIIPEAEVVEFAVRAKARQSARAAIQRAAEAEVADITRSRRTLRVQLERFSALFAGLMVVAAAVLLFFLYGHNVKERRHEIAILRTLGVGGGQIYRLFAAKAALLAVTGSIVGYLGALLLVQSLTDGATFCGLWTTSMLLVLLVGANVVSLSASLIPAMIAARRAPGIVLNEEA